MTNPESYEALVFLIKLLGVFVLLIAAVVVVAHAHAPDFPDDDGERM